MQNDRELTRDCNFGLAEPVALGEPRPGRALAEPRLLRIEALFDDLLGHRRMTGHHRPVSTSVKRHRGDDDQSYGFDHLQKSLNLPGDNSVYRTVCWMLRWPR